MRTLKVLQVGLGPIGQRVVRYALERDGLEVVGAVDPGAGKGGRDIGDVCELGAPLGIEVCRTLEAALERCEPDVAVLATTSDLTVAAAQIEKIASRSIAVVSSCEELSHPWDTAPDLASRLDAIAKERSVAILGTGVNPGFLMDFLPLAMTAICQKVESIHVQRFQDASIRRIPFQQKIGAALTLEEFEAKKRTGTLRHVGLTESIQMIARRLNWTLDRTEEILTPVVADREIASGYAPIRKGMAAGVQQIGKGFVDGKKAITLEFRAAVGEPNPRESIRIEGEPSFESVVAGGINGDVATCAIIVNGIRAVADAAPGLRTMADIEPLSFYRRP